VGAVVLGAASLAAEMYLGYKAGQAISAQIIQRTNVKDTQMTAMAQQLVYRHHEEVST
jgi:hypothetical protein